MPNLPTVTIDTRNKGRFDDLEEALKPFHRATRTIVDGMHPYGETTFEFRKDGVYLGNAVVTAHPR